MLERGTVLGLIHRAKVSLVLKCKMMLDAARAIAYLHENGVLYRDLKPDNLLVASVSHTANTNCKLSDFGTAIIVDDVSVAKRHTGSIGTPVYMAPEMMQNGEYNAGVDVYSLAMTMWEILSEKAPFGHLKRIWDLPRLVLDGMRPEVDSDWDKKLAKVIGDCWLHNAERRPSAKEAAEQLEKIYEKLRKAYDKEKASKKTKGLQGDSEEGESKGRTAHTGQLNELIEMGREHADSPLSTNDGRSMMQRADDLATTDEEKPKKKKAKSGKKKKSKAAADTGSV